MSTAALKIPRTPIPMELNSLNLSHKGPHPRNFDVPLNLRLTLTGSSWGHSSTIACAHARSLHHPATDYRSLDAAWSPIPETPQVEFMYDEPKSMTSWRDDITHENWFAYKIPWRARLLATAVNEDVLSLAHDVAERTGRNMLERIMAGTYNAYMDASSRGAVDDFHLTEHISHYLKMSAAAMHEPIGVTAMISQHLQTNWENENMITTRLVGANPSLLPPEPPKVDGEGAW